MRNEVDLNDVQDGGKVLVLTSDGGSRELPITVAPSWVVRIDQDIGGEDCIDLDMPGIAPNTEWMDPDHAVKLCGEYDKVSRNAMFPGGIYNIDLDGVDIDDPLAIAIEIITLAAVTTAHEAIEWTLVNGQRVAEPHPNDNDGISWATLRNGIRAAVLAHITKHPTRPS